MEICCTAGESLRSGPGEWSPNVADVEGAHGGAHSHMLGDNSAAHRTRGTSTGMSQPLNSTIFAPIWRWTAFSAVLRMTGRLQPKTK